MKFFRRLSVPARAHARTHAHTFRRAAQHRRCALCGWRSPAGEARAAVGGLACGACSPRCCAMCGIFAYASAVPQPRTQVLETLLQGLERLEYRGYDSAGIAVDAAPHDGGAKGAGGSVDDRERRKPTPSTRQQLQTGRPEPEGAARRLFARRKCARGNALAPGVEWCRGCAQLRRMHLPDSH